MKSIITIFIALCYLGVSGQTTQLRKVDSIVESKIGKHDPALMVGVVKDGNIIYQRQLGLANLQHQVKANKRTRSNIASVAKQYTALMILHLSLENKLSLEDDIRKYLPSLYPKVKEKIKIRHLINHSSGIRDYSDLLSLKRKPWWRQVGMDNDDVMELLGKQKELAFPPGSRDMYSNSGYTVLTKVIEKVTGKKFYDFSKKFFEELGMEETAFSKNYMGVIPNKADPYSDWGDGVWQEYPVLTNLNGDGFLYTTLKDQLIYEQAVQNADHNNHVLLIKSQQPIPNSEIKTYGFGLELENRLNRTSVHHSGGTGSFHAQTVRFPEEKISVFVMSSNSRIWSGYIADEVASVFLKKKERVNNYDSRMKEEFKFSSEEDLTGQYRSPGEYLIRIYKKDGKLYWRNANNNPFELFSENKNVYNFGGTSTTKIGFYDNEMNLFYPSGKKSIYKKIPYEKPSLADMASYAGKYYSDELEVGFEIKMTKENQLSILLPEEDEEEALEILNRNELLVWDYIMKIERDQFDRVTDILVTTNRILNNRFKKKTNLKFQPRIETENGSIQVSTIGSKSGNSSSILLTKNLPNGNELWYKKFGGKSYDKASSILDTEDGYLIVGSTSSYGKGNYDIFVLKTDKKGKKLWQNTYGGFYNEYGYSAERTDSGYIIKGTKQHCENNSDINRKCKNNVWFVTIDKKGRAISDEILEKI